MLLSIKCAIALCLKKIYRYLNLKYFSAGVPVVAQRLTDLTRNREVVGSIPGLTQWVKDPTLP